MTVTPKLKPLFANLKRLKIGKYLNTEDFNLFTIEYNIDDLWGKCKKFVLNKRGYVYAGPHDSADDEEAFGYFLTYAYNENYDSFGKFITDVLKNFSKWNFIKTDLNPIYKNLKLLGLKDKLLLDFINETRKIKESKPEKVNDNQIKKIDSQEIQLDKKKVFIVHGHDDKSRLELTRIIKDDLGLTPIVLQEEPNVSMETIISKLDRLTKDCYSALILFTPDDNANGEFRARQNVILELGYFLGKFQGSEKRKIAIIKNGNIEIPSDISGVLYLEYQKNIKEIFYDLQRQFITWGIK